METSSCHLKKQGYLPGSCGVRVDGKHQLACQATLKHDAGHVHRLITSIHLSRPENYLSIYQSGCNFSCKKCHSWHFSKVQDGDWFRPEDILEKCVAYDKQVTLKEPREKATAWHAQESCRCCGSCVTSGKRPGTCPGVLDTGAVLLSPQGFGPARNIVAFTGGDLTCCPEFYETCAHLIKTQTSLWVLVETNGYGLTRKTLDGFRASGVDAFWLDIKAHDDKKHTWLTGCSNEHILRLPEAILKRGFVLEVLSLYIPGLIESDELESIARDLAAVDPKIPFTLLAFFPEYRMKDFKSPTTKQMVEAYKKVKATGLENIRLGNLGVFVRNQKDQDYLMANIDMGGL